MHFNNHHRSPPPPVFHMAKPPPPPPPPPNPGGSTTSPTGPSPTRLADITLLQPASQRKRGTKSPKVLRVFRSVFRSLPIMSPACRFHGSIPRSSINAHNDGHIHGATRTTGTLFGHRKGRISIAIQDNSRSVPFLVLELAIPTARFMQDMGTGLLRVALECEKKAGERIRLLEERLWCAFVNGRRIGYAQRREPNQSDLHVLQLLHAVSMGAGVLPPQHSDPSDGELTYMRAHFDRVVGSRDSETFYMLNPDGNSGPELSIFFVRI